MAGEPSRAARIETVRRRKTRPLAAADLAGFTLKRCFRDALAEGGGGPLRVLDMGCGRGDTVAHLLRLGHHAVGAEVSDGQADLARRGLAGLGLDPGAIAQPDPDGGRYPLPDGAFDLILSDNVIEHVADLDAFAAEVARLTAPGGRGVHIFPSKWKPVESHVHAPLVHWLPKSAVRYPLLRLCVALGSRAGSVEDRGLSGGEIARIYQDYLAQSTFYRPIGRITAALEARGLACDTGATGRLAADRLPLPALRPLLAGPLTALSLRFHTTVLRTAKAGP